jgi:hypothetical protein
MSELRSKYLPFAWIFFWPVILLVQLGSRDHFREILKVGFWLDLGACILIGLAMASAGAGCIYAYWRFCQWFNRAVDRQKAHALLRNASVSGEVTWASSDPLYDPDLDQSTKAACRWHDQFTSRNPHHRM